MIKAASIYGKSGTAYTVFDLPIITWKQYPIKGIYFLTKGNKQNYHDLILMGESENISQSIKSSRIIDKAHCLYILFVKDHFDRKEILKDIEKSIMPAEKKKLIHILPQEEKAG